MKHPLLVVLIFFTAATAAPSHDWSFWRGPEQNGVSRERDLPVTPAKVEFDEKELPKEVLFASPHGSMGTPIVFDGQVYLLGKSGHGPTQQETVMAFDANTGKLLWEHKYNVWHTDIVDDRLGFTNMAGDPETGYVYAHMTSGEFLCFDKKGKLIWRRSLTEEFGRVSGYGGRITTPIVDEDKVILSMASASWGEQTIGGTRVVAFDKRTGKVVWWGSGGYRVKDTYYSVPVVAVIAGQRLLLTGGGDGCIHAFKVRTGEKAWSYKFEDGGGAINCSPVVKGDKIWIAHGEENQGGNQGRVICLDGGKLVKGEPTLVWKYDGVKVKFASPILHEGLLYVCDDAGKLFCFDAEKGDEPVWEFRYGRNTKGSPVLADGKIYVSDVDSEFHILQVNGQNKPKRLSRIRFPAVGIVPTELHGSPAVLNGRVYFTTTTHLVCLGQKGGKAAPVKIPPAAKEPAAGAKPAHIQVVPADVTLRPGEKVDLKAIAYDDKGRKIGEVKVDWEKAGMLPPVFPIGMPAPKPGPKAPAPPAVAGELSETNGTTTSFTAAKMPNGQFGRVVAKLGGVTGSARIRVAPVLPYTMDFDKVPNDRTPGGWVNTMGKFMVTTLPDGSKVLRKRNDTPNPLVAMVNAYITDPSLSDYTIESDVYGTKVRNKDMPEVGIGAMRYVLYMVGNDQELRLVTWDAQKRVAKKISFDFKPETWYRMKLTATVKDGKGVVQGKVWARGEKEPEKWTIEIEDPIPNTEGAAVIYGSVLAGTVDAAHPGPEIYYDNVRITPNKK